MLPSSSDCFKLFFSLIILVATLDSAFSRNLFERSISTQKIQPKMDKVVAPKMTREMLFEWKNSPVKNIWEDSGLFEGDIVLKDNERNGVTDERKRWPIGVIPYKIEGNYNEYEEEKLKFVMEEYNNRTCIKFRPYKNSDEHFIIFKSQPGCWSSVGRSLEVGGQVINLQSDKCFTFGTIAHELLHVIGFWHQQSATNRDQFVTIMWENIHEDKKHNFKKYPNTEVMDFRVWYDYNSIMHYGRQAFTKNGKDTIVPHDPKARIGQQHELSEKDIIKIRKMYKCPEGLQRFFLLQKQLTV